MLTTFLYTIKVLIRDKSVLLWAVAFPLILSTLFYSMFNKLDETYQLDPMPVLVVEDSNYRDADAFSTLIKELSKSADGNDALFAPTFVDSESKAQTALLDGEYLGYIKVDGEGRPSYSMNSQQAGGLDIIPAIKQNIVLSILDRYTQDYEMILDIAVTNPQLFANPDFLNSLTSQQSYVERGSITANPPSDSLRYYYAVLAFSCIMMMSFGLSAIDFWKANTSSYGARRALGGQSWVQSLAPTLLAAWLLSYVCVIIGFVYIRFGFGVSFGGKEPVCLLVLAISTLVSTLVGAVFGAAPIPGGGKSGLSAFLSCFLSLFAGLYGPASQQLGDYVASNLPALSTINPVRQVCEAFFSLYYYDGYDRFAEILVTLSIMAGVFFVATVLMMRKQRYKSL